MNNAQRGFAWGVALLLFAMIAAGGAYVYINKSSASPEVVSDTSTEQTSGDVSISDILSAGKRAAPAEPAEAYADVSSNESAEASPVVKTLPLAASSSAKPVSPPESKPKNSATSNSITACAILTKPGNYIVSADIYGEGASENQGCITIKDTSNVFLDCAGHSIKGAPALLLEDVNNFSVKNCKLSQPDEVMGQIYTMIVKSASAGTFSDNFFGPSYSQLTDAKNVILERNKFNSFLQFSYSRDNSVRNNTFTLPKWNGLTSAVLSFQYGGGNVVSGNNIDGMAKGVFEDKIGADDAITIFDESGDKVENNVLRNNWDCGIETFGVVTNSVFRANKIYNSGVCGIGAWYNSSWMNNVVSGNFISDAPQPIYFFYEFGLRPGGFDKRKTMPADRGVYFTNNIFENNVTDNSRQESHSSHFIKIGVNDTLGGFAGERNAQTSDLVVSNNVFRNNNFGSQKMLIFEPAGGIVDGGGNRCNPPSGDYALNCIR